MKSRDEIPVLAVLIAIPVCLAIVPVLILLMLSFLVVNICTDGEASFYKAP